MCVNGNARQSFIKNEECSGETSGASSAPYASLTTGSVLQKSKNCHSERASGEESSV